MARKSREAGMMPAVIYGHGEPTQSITLEFRDVESALTHGARTLQLALGGSLFDFLEANDYEGAPLLSSLGGWLEQGAARRGQDIICYHVNWSYFEDRFGVNCAEYVETKPGIPPTPRHVARLLELMRGRGLSVVLAASYFDARRVESVAARGNATAVIVPMGTPARPGLDTYFDLVDRCVTELTAALR